MSEYRVEEFAQMIGESTTTVRQMIKDGELDVYRPIGKKYYLIRGLKDEKDDSQSLPEESNIAEYRVEDYALMIGKSTMTVHRMIKDGRLDAYRPIGKKYYLIRVKKDDKSQILPKESNNAEYRVEEYAKMIGKSAMTVHKMIRGGKLDAYRPIGKKYYLIRGLKDEKDDSQASSEESNIAEYRVEEYAKLIGKAAITVRRMIRDGKLDAYRPIGKNYCLIRVKKDDKPQILPEESNSVTLSVMLDKINTLDKDTYRSIIKQIYLAYCQIVL